MNDKEFVARVKMLADKSDLNLSDKKERCLFIAAACDSDEHEQLIKQKLDSNDITFESLFEYVMSILPEVEIVDDDEE